MGVFPWVGGLCGAAAFVLMVGCGGSPGASQPAGLGAAEDSTPAGASATPDPDPERWAPLRRPLTALTPGSGDTCERSTVHPIPGSEMKGLGEGPVYVLGSAGTLQYGTYTTGDWVTWGAQKFGLLVSPEFKGEALVRGASVDGRHAVRFGDGPSPPEELNLTLEGNATTGGQPRGSRLFMTYLRLEAPGCYFLQIDAIDFSQTITFEAEFAGMMSR
ncbi:MAG: hypothetical protein C0506_05550 [Anaerolinea sp.]|nr:hypothetical protein [Anaerolinea sp.]